MKTLVLPVPESLSASYLIPLSSAVTSVAAQRQVTKAVQARLTGVLRTLALEWIKQGAVSIEVTAEQTAAFAQAPMFVRVAATHPASLIAMHEWKARGPAGALAATLGTPLLDQQASEVLSAEDALAALPDATMADGSADLSISVGLGRWVRFHDEIHHGKVWVMSEGMRRLGLPEFRAGGGAPRLREELTQLLEGVTFLFWSDLLARAQAIPNGLVGLPPLLQVPAEMHVHRADLDRARGAPNRGGSVATIGLRLDADARGETWLTVCPPDYWDMCWEDFVADTCHALFAFEKPSYYYLPEFGKLMQAMDDARRTLPQARSRFADGRLPSRGQLMVRHRLPEKEFRWARVESWATEDEAIVRGTGRELTPGVRLGPPVPVAANSIVDWAIWVDGAGVVEGGGTEGRGRTLA
jgi:hypothetical protein